MTNFLFFTAQEMRGLQAVTVAAGGAGLRAADQAAFSTAWDILEHEQTLEPANARRFEAFFSAQLPAEVARALAEVNVNPASYGRALAKIRLRASE